MKQFYLTLISFLLSLVTYSQNIPEDVLNGNVKRIRSKVIFLTEKENHQLLYYNDYGHSGFMGPERTVNRFYKMWYSTDQSYYINYERFFDNKKHIIKENWYGKKDDFLNSYRYVYNEKDSLITEIDSTDYSVTTARHYYDYDCKSTIRTSSQYNHFSHNFYQYKDGKMIRLKRFDERGTVDEYIYKYNKNGDLEYRIYKDPNSWRNENKDTWSYGVQDSVLTIYKDLVNEYDDQNRLTKAKRFSQYSNHDHNGPISSGETTYIYDKDNLITLIDRDVYRYYKYDNNKKLSESYCCNKDISKAMAIEKYTYRDDQIYKLKYSETDWQTKLMKAHYIEFKYTLDKNNNWIEIIKKVDGKDLYKWVREIEYY